MSNQASQVAHINAMNDNFYNETNCKAKYHLVDCPVTVYACTCVRLPIHWSRFPHTQEKI